MLNNATNASLSFWVKPLVTGAEYMAGYSTNVGNGAFYVNSDANNKIKVRVSNPAAGLTIESPSNTFVQNVWQHIIVVFDASQTLATDVVKMYKNGVQVASTVVSGTKPSDLGTTSLFSLGGANGTVFAYCNMDEPAIFDYSLTASEVSDIYNSGCPTDLMSLAAAKRPEHYYRMGDGDTYPTINDIGETGTNNGTMTNMESGDIVTDTPC
jgi:hypothetical protein